MLEKMQNPYMCVTLNDIPLWPAYAQTKCIESLNGTKYNLHIELNNKISIYKGDITKLLVDVIVNSTSNSLLEGGGGIIIINSIIYFQTKWDLYTSMYHLI